MSITSIKISIFAILMMALTGCFSVEIDAPNSVEQNEVFSMTATAKKNKGEVSYQWSLNNDAISEDITHHTMLPALGEYTLTVSAVDAEGNEDSQSKIITVVAQPSLNPNFSFGINVSDKEGFAIPDATVTVNGVTVLTNQYGLAQFDGISQTSLMLVSASKENYLTQTYQYNFDAAQESAVATLALQGLNPVSHTVDSNEEINITEAELHTKLTIDANSFVDESGNAVVGDVDITITPIDIRAVGSAFLGGAQALTNSGEAVALISMGMTDYQFAQNGSVVSLAKGASAIIEMDIAVTTGDDGRVFVEGDTIEMWWFDTETGFWIEDGIGMVELSDTSETGLKLVATVKHFTTWNWDYYKQDDRSSIAFKCLKDGLPLASDESCNITASSATFSRQVLAGSEGVMAINTPPSITYNVVANLSTGSNFWTGIETFTSISGNNTVTVDMELTPTKTGYIQCRVINDEETLIAPCDVTISAGSISNQEIDTENAINFRTPFIYIKGDVLDISSTIGGGFNRNALIDTSAINGTLDLELIYDVSYDAVSDNLYTFECVNELDENLDCDIIWYDRFERIIFEGNINELTDPNSPFPGGKIYIESPEEGFGQAKSQSKWGYDNYSEDTVINTTTKVIKFIIIDEPR